MLNSRMKYHGAPLQQEFCKKSNIERIPKCKRDENIQEKQLTCLLRFGFRTVMIKMEEWPICR